MPCIHPGVSYSTVIKDNTCFYHFCLPYGQSHGGLTSVGLTQACPYYTMACQVMQKFFITQYRYHSLEIFRCQKIFVDTETHENLLHGKF